MISKRDDGRIGGPLGTRARWVRDGRRRGGTATRESEPLAGRDDIPTGGDASDIKPISIADEMKRSYLDYEIGRAHV